MNKSYILGTLGNDRGYLTCSMYVGNKRYMNSKIRGYSTYESAAYDVKSGGISALLVPVAYPKINNLVMDESLISKEVFIEQIPSLVLIKKSMYCDIKKVERIYLHAATNKLLDDIFSERSNVEIIYVDSNIMSCESLIKDNNKNVAAITNILCANYYDLHIEKVLRKGVQMPWVLFEKNGE